MADALGTTVRIDADSSQFKQGIDQDIAALKAMGQTIDVTNRGAVAAWRAEVAAQKDNMAAIGATTAQMEALGAATVATEAKITAASDAMGRSFTSISRGLFMMSGQQNDLLASSRGIVTAVSASAMMLGGPWAAALAVASIALLRFFDKMDEGMKKFDKDFKEMMANIEKLGPAGEAAGVGHAEQMLKENEARLRVLEQRTGAGGENLISALLEINKLKKQDADITEGIVKANLVAIPAKQHELLLESFRTVLMREQSQLLKDQEAMQRAKNIAEEEMYRHRVEADQAALARTTALIGRQGFDDRQMVGLGKDIAGFAGAQAERDTDATVAARGATMARNFQKVLDAAANAIEHMPEPTKLDRSLALDALLGVDPKSTRETPGEQRAAEGLGQAFLRAYKKAQEETKKMHLPASQLGTPGYTDQFVPDLKEYSAWERAIHKIVEANKLLTTSNIENTTSYRVLSAAASNALDYMVTAKKASVGKLAEAALQPIIAELEGEAIKYGGLAIAAALTGNFALAAKDAAAAIALTAAAHEVSSLAGRFGGGGGGGGGSGGGGQGGGTSAGTGAADTGSGTSKHGQALGMSGISGLGAQRSQQHATLEVILTQKSPDNRTLAQTRTNLQRLDDRRVPVRFNLG